MLIVIVVTTVCFLSIPLAVNIYLVQRLEAHMRVASASSRREFVLWSAAQLMADMQSGAYYTYAAPAIPVTEVAGELAYLQHHITTCDSSGANLEWFVPFATTPVVCSPRAVDPTGTMTGLLLDVKSSVVNGSTVVEVIRSYPPTTEAVQFVLYALDAMRVFPLTPTVVEAFRNMTAGRPITDATILATPTSLWTDTNWQRYWCWAGTGGGGGGGR